MLVSAEATFNYTVVDPDIAASARYAAERIRLRIARTNEDIIEIGRDLLAQKEALGHGNFLPWIESEFGMSEQSAQRFMGACTKFGSNPSRVRDLTPKALYLLTGPSADPIRDEVLARVDKGERVTAKDIEDLKAKLKKAKELAADKASLVSLHDARARQAEAQRDKAQTELLFAKDDKVRLTDDLNLTQAEVDRLTAALESEKADKTLYAVVEHEPQPAQLITVPAAPISLLLQVFDLASDDDIRELLLVRRDRLIKLDA